MGLLPDDWREYARDEDARSEAVRMYVYDTPQDARLKYLINFKLPNEPVDDISSKMLELRGVSESSFCREMYMDEADLRSLSDTGHVVGNHGHSHVPFSRLDSVNMADEILKNNKMIGKIIGQPRKWVCYPNGRLWAVPGNCEAFCKEFGFRIGLGLDGGWNGREVNPFCMNRLNTNDVIETCGEM